MVEPKGQDHRGFFVHRWDFGLVTKNLLISRLKSRFNNNLSSPLTSFVHNPKVYFWSCSSLPIKITTTSIYITLNTSLLLFLIIVMIFYSDLLFSSTFPSTLLSFFSFCWFYSLSLKIIVCVINNLCVENNN